MNAIEQRNHRRVTDELAASINELAAATSERIMAEVGSERTHRLRLADEQRAYVDARDRELRECCQTRWDETNKAQGRIIARMDAVLSRKLFGRLKWLIVGR